MNPEQFNQIVEAILAGKYSWACVLILRFTGYNPLHYIPYRTYNRLLKENCQNGSSIHRKVDSIRTSNQAPENQCDRISNRESFNKIADLNYLEVVREETSPIRGGHQAQWFNEKLEEDNSNTWELAPYLN